MDRILNMEGEAQYEHVSRLDPLNLDEFFVRLPEINKYKQADLIIDQLSESSRILLNEPPQSKEESLACLRDLDFLLGSTVKHGVDPLTASPCLEQQLLELGRDAGTVPRGSVYTYSTLNPGGERRRSFTNSTEENVFIDAVTNSVNSLETSYQVLSSQLVGNNYGFCGALNKVSDSVDVMASSIVQVYRRVSPQFFTEEMRPFFEPLIIGGTEYAGAGGAQMQLLGVDFMLWGMDETDSTYAEYFAENFQYLTPAQQKATEQFLLNNEVSIVGWIREEASSGDAVVDSAANLIRKLRKFRYPHRKVAQANFQVRANGSVGSGKYTPDILDYLIQRTEVALATVEAING